MPLQVEQRYLSRLGLLIIDELGDVPRSPTGAELLFEVFSQRYKRGSIMVTTNLPFDEWTEVFGSERLTGALLDRLTHHIHILEMNGDSYRLKRSRENAASQVADDPEDSCLTPELPTTAPDLTPTRLPIQFFLIVPVGHDSSAAVVHLLAALDIRI